MDTRLHFYSCKVNLFTAILGRLLGGFSFSQYTFIMVRYDPLHIIHTGVANFDRVAVEDFIKG